MDDECVECGALITTIFVTLADGSRICNACDEDHFDTQADDDYDSARQEALDADE